MSQDEKITSYNLNEEINKFLDESSFADKDGPVFVLIIGGVGAGKTTLRKDKFSKGYVVIDAGLIFQNLGGTELHEFGRDFMEPMDILGWALVKRAIKDKRNIVTEIIGSAVEAESIINSMKSLGYRTNLQLVECDPIEAYKRHLAAVQTDPNYISSYFTQSYHLKWILESAKKYS